MTTIQYTFGRSSWSCCMSASVAPSDDNRVVVYNGGVFDCQSADSMPAHFFQQHGVTIIDTFARQLIHSYSFLAMHIHCSTGKMNLGRKKERYAALTVGDFLTILGLVKETHNYILEHKRNFFIVYEKFLNQKFGPYNISNALLFSGINLSERRRAR